MAITRRKFFLRSGAGMAALALTRARGEGAPPAPGTKLHIGSMDGVLGGGGVRALEAAARCGIEGVEVGLGPSGDHLALLDEGRQAAYRAKEKELGVKVPSLCLGVLNGVPLKSDPRAERWLSEAIDIAKGLGARTILVPFFGRGTLRSRVEMARVADIIKGLAPKALERGVTLALENTLSAKDNVWILERVKASLEAVAIYYDVKNSTANGYDVPAEIRFLGEKIRQFHFKDGRYLLGKGPVRYAPIRDAIRAIGYRGWIVLETGRPLGVEVSAGTNAGFIRGLFCGY